MKNNLFKFLGVFFAICIFVFALIVIITGFIKTAINKVSLDKNAAYVYAVIVKFEGAGTSNYVHYTFSLDSTDFFGSHPCSYNPDFSVGDTLIVVYDRMNPNNNTPYDYYRKLFYATRNPRSVLDPLLDSIRVQQQLQLEDLTERQY